MSSPAAIFAQLISIAQQPVFAFVFPTAGTHVLVYFLTLEKSGMIVVHYARVGPHAGLPCNPRTALGVGDHACVVGGALPVNPTHSDPQEIPT